MRKESTMSSEFDLDLSFETEPADPDLSGLDEAILKAEIAKLPAALREVANGLILEQRTMSDVSQALAIRQSELVTRLHRAKHAIAHSLGL